MQNGSKTMTSTHRPKSARPFSNRSKQWTSNVARPDVRGPQNAHRSYERYLALAQLKPNPATRLGPKTTTSTPSIISDPCRQSEKRRRRIRRPSLSHSASPRTRRRGAKQNPATIQALDGYSVRAAMAAGAASHLSVPERRSGNIPSFKVDVVDDWRTPLEKRWPQVRLTKERSLWLVRKVKLATCRLMTSTTFCVLSTNGCIKRARPIEIGERFLRTGTIWPGRFLISLLA